jgi:DNA-binding MarR family transcriptional regulator
MIDDMSSAPSGEADFGILFALAFRCYVDHLHTELAERGFTPVRPAFGPVLRALRSREDTLTGLARELAVSKQAVSRVVDDMRTAGLVSQGSDPADGRARPLALTPRGEAMVDAAVAVATAYEHSLVASLGSDGAQALRQALTHIVESGGRRESSPPGVSAPSELVSSASGIPAPRSPPNGG